MVDTQSFILGHESHEMISQPMQSLASLLAFVLPTPSLAPDSFARMVAHVDALSALLVSTPLGFSIHRIEGAFIGLSCLAIAATLASFLMTTDRSIPFRWMLIGLTLCTTVAGLFSFFCAALLRSEHPVVASLAPLSGVVLALLTACLLPFLLPLLVSKARELDVTSLAVRQAESRFQAATQSSSDAFMLLDALRSPDGQIEDFLFTYVNTNAEKIIQLPGSRILGSRLTRVLPMDPGDRLFQQFCQVLVTGKPLIHEFSIDPKDPASPWVRHYVARLGEEGEFGLAITASDITERKYADRILNPAALAPEPDVQHDPLTGLPNRRLLEDRMQQAMARADRFRNRVAVILVDIDGFRKVNETYGRDLGDLALRALALRLRSAIRGTDSVLRLEGDEFLVIMPDMRREIDVRRTAATLVALLHEPVILQGRAVRLSCSLGVTAYPDTAPSAPELLTAAAAALNQARQQGGNQYVLHTALADSGVDADAVRDADFDSEDDVYSAG